MLDGLVRQEEGWTRSHERELASSNIPDRYQSAVDLVRRSEFDERLVSPPEVAEADIIPYIRISLIRSAISAPDKRP